MKLTEKPMWMDDKLLIIKNTHTATPAMEAVRAARDAGLGQKGEYRHVGRVPAAMVTTWLREAGVKWNDTQARQDVINRKMMSGEFSAFRNWEGSF